MKQQLSMFQNLKSPPPKGMGLNGAGAPFVDFARPTRNRSLNSVSRAPAPEIAAFFPQEARQNHVVHLGSAVD
jgi:hypothetical protein